MIDRIVKLLHRAPRGQAIVLVAMMMLALVGMTGLAIDVSSALLTQRFERSVADAAALAGAQDLQLANSRVLPTAGSPQVINAQTHAMQVVVVRLGATSTPTSSSCYTSTGCPLPGTPYVVSIRWNPVGSCVECAGQEELAIQVTIKQPSFGLTFARVFNQTQWTVSASSVGEIIRAKKYGFIVLRPPKPRSNGDANQDNIRLTGGSQITIQNGDVGTNTNMIMTAAGGGAASQVNLDPGYKVYYYDPPPQAWTAPPPGGHVTTLIRDPGYTIPQRTPSTPIFNTTQDARDTGPANSNPAGDATAGDCAAQRALVPPTYQVNGVPIQSMPGNLVFCFKPGIYNMNGGLVNNSNAQVILLEPGVYFFDNGLSAQATVIGGFAGGQPGVALVFPEAATSGSRRNGQLTANNAPLLALNFGSAYGDPNGTRATAAICDASNGCMVGPQGLVQTSTAPPLLMSIMVVPDPLCYVAETEPASCNDSNNKTLNLPGGGALFLAGVQYAPTDNASTSGNAGQAGTVGQMIAWTIVYNSSFLNLESAYTDARGVLRLDSGCSPGSTVCSP